MGLVMIGLAWSEAAFVFSMPTAPGGLAAGFAAGLLVLLSAVTAVAMVRHKKPAADLEVALAGAGTAGVLLAAAALPRAPILSAILWGSGIAGLAAGTVLAVLPVLRRRQDPLTLRPALFVLPSGFLVAPVAGTALGLYEISILLYLAGLLFALALYGQTMAHRVSGWVLPEPAGIERAAGAGAPAFAFLGYQGIIGGFVDPTTLILAALVLPVLGELRPAAQAARRAPADPRVWLTVTAVAAVALVLLILYEQIGGAALATASTVALAAASMTALLALYFCLSAAARGTLQVPYRQPPPAER